MGAENCTENREQRGKDQIYMVDLTCRTAPYDRRLCEALESEGVTVELWAAGCYSNTLYQSGVDVSRALDVMAHLSAGPWLTKRLKALEYVLNLVVLCVRLLLRPVPVIHFQWLPLLDVVGLELLLVKLAQQRGARVVYTVHDLLPLDTNTEATEERRRFAAVYRQVDALICHTKTSQERLIKEFGVRPSKVWHIPHGPLSAAQLSCDGDGGSSMIQAEDVTGVSDDIPSVLLFGVLRPYKGYDFLLRTWPQVRSQVEDAHLVIVGSAKDPVQKEIESLIREEGIDESVSRTYRYVSDAELHAVIEAADILIYPYRNITQSGALFTGMEAGKAIVATDVGGLGETIQSGETGRLVSYGDVEGLAEALVDLMSDPEERHQLGATARKDLQTRLSWRGIARKTEECYQKVVSSQ